MHTLLIILLLMVITFSIFTNRRSLIEGKKNKKKKRKQKYKRKTKKDAGEKRKKLREQKRDATSKAQKKRIKRRQRELKNRTNKKLAGDVVQYKAMKRKGRKQANKAAEEAEKTLEFQDNLDEYFEQNFGGSLLDDANFWKTFALTQNTQGINEWENLDRTGRRDLLQNTYDEAVRTFT